MKIQNIVCHNSTVTQERREQLNKHRSVVIWLTGLSGSGKSTLAYLVEEELYKLNCRTFVLDGDNIRYGLSSDLSFSSGDRKENIRRSGEVAKLMMEAGLIVIAAFISPFREDRASIRKMLTKNSFIEIFCNSSLDVCESRDVKSLYKKARAGEIKNYTGINSPYEEPINPELVVNTGNESLSESVDKIISYLESREIFGQDCAQ